MGLAGLIILMRRDHLCVVAVHRLAGADAGLRRAEDPQHRARQRLCARRLRGGQLRRAGGLDRAGAGHFSLVAMLLAAAAVAVVVGPLLERGSAGALFYGRDEVLAAAGHLRALPDAGGRDQAGLGRQPVLRQRALPAVRQPRGAGPAAGRLRPADRGAGRRLRPGHLVRAEPHGGRQGGAGGDPQPGDERQHGRGRAAGLHHRLHHRRLPGRARRRLHLADDLGAAGAVGQRDRGQLRGGDHRRPRQASRARPSARWWSAWRARPRST